MSTPEVTGGPAPTPPGAARDASRVRENGLLGWLLVREELAHARANAARFSAEQREFLRRAKLAFELGELALSPGNAVHSGSTSPLAANLFRQSVYWALLARKPERRPLAPDAIGTLVDAETLASAGASDSERAQIATAMRSTFVELAEGSPELQRATAELLRRWATRLITDAQGVLWRFEWAKLKRIVRIAVLAIVVLIPAAFAVNLLLVKPDLAKGAPWRVSSVGAECHPEKSECAGGTTDILFHTKLEQNPWFEYDFGSPLSFSSLTIRNRSDFGPERAVPLVVEVSDDDKNFREIVRRDDVFTVWRPKFATQRARYLRLRVARESILHLEAIKVHS
jgi:hypothetical protein